jgi:hypothetical protein
LNGGGSADPIGEDEQHKMSVEPPRARISQAISLLVFTRRSWAVCITMAALVFVTCTLAACSQIRSAPARHVSFGRFLASDFPAILIYRPPLSVRSPAVLIGGKDQGAELSALARVGNPLQRVAEQFISLAGLPESTRVIEVTPDSLAELRGRDPNQLVLFLFSGGWYLDYQRFPLNLRDYRLSFSIIGKLVPLGVVVSGKGALALPSASWESSCYHVGGRHSLDVWREGRGEMLRKEMIAGLDFCGGKLVADFMRAAHTSIQQARQGSSRTRRKLAKRGTPRAVSPWYL